MKNFFLLGCFALLLACQQNNEGQANSASGKIEDKVAGKEFEMYSMSEMSLLMEQMYVDNERLKKRIQNGDTIGEFPNHFMKIHQASMTDDTENDEFFKAKAAEFIMAQELIYKDPKNAKEHFNNGVSACIECHTVKCGGPIPRIKKLYIN